MKGISKLIMYLMALLLSIELTMGLATVNVIAKEQFMIRNMELENTKYPY